MRLRKAQFNAAPSRSFSDGGANVYSNVHSDSQCRLDLSANQAFRISGQFRIGFRADTFNASNEVVLRNPNTDPVSTANGTVTPREPRRSWQFLLTLKS